jgi:hypothetical protein
MLVLSLFAGVNQQSEKLQYDHNLSSDMQSKEVSGAVGEGLGRKDNQLGVDAEIELWMEVVE